MKKQSFLVLGMYAIVSCSHFLLACTLIACSLVTSPSHAAAEKAVASPKIYMSTMQQERARHLLQNAIIKHKSNPQLVKEALEQGADPNWPIVDNPSYSGYLLLTLDSPKLPYITAVTTVFGSFMAGIPPLPAIGLSALCGLGINRIILPKVKKHAPCVLTPCQAAVLLSQASATDNIIPTLKLLLDADADINATSTALAPYSVDRPILQNLYDIYTYELARPNITPVNIDHINKAVTELVPFLILAGADQTRIAIPPNLNKIVEAATALKKRHIIIPYDTLINLVGDASPLRASLQHDACTVIVLSYLLPSKTLSTKDNPHLPWIVDYHLRHPTLKQAREMQTVDAQRELTKLLHRPKLHKKKTGIPDTQSSHPTLSAQEIAATAAQQQQLESKKLVEALLAHQQNPANKKTHHYLYDLAQSCKLVGTDKKKHAQELAKALAQITGDNGQKQSKRTRTAPRQTLASQQAPHTPMQQALATPSSHDLPSATNEHIAENLSALSQESLANAHTHRSSDQGDLERTAHASPSPRQPLPPYTPHTILTPLRPSSAEEEDEDEKTQDAITHTTTQPTYREIPYGNDILRLNTTHLFQGESNDRGFHHDEHQKWQRTHAHSCSNFKLFPELNGCYSLKINGGKKSKSFFPSCVKQKILEDQIVHAIQNDVAFFHHAQPNHAAKKQRTSTKCFGSFEAPLQPGITDGTIHFMGIIKPTTNIIQSIYPITKERYEKEQGVTPADQPSPAAAAQNQSIVTSEQ